MMEEHFSSISALRIYLRRGDVKKSTSWWARLAEKPLSTFLVQAAMQAGIVHAAVNLSQIGYTRDATKITHDNGEIPMNALPICVELLAPKRVLEQFIRDQARHLKNTTLVMVDGVHISDLYLAEVEESIERKPHSVEYIRRTDGETEVELEHVDVDEKEETAQPQTVSSRATQQAEQNENVIA
jgi:PII-like signaling protein